MPAIAFIIAALFLGTCSLQEDNAPAEDPAHLGTPRILVEAVDAERQGDTTYLRYSLRTDPEAPPPDVPLHIEIQGDATPGSDYGTPEIQDDSGAWIPLDGPFQLPDDGTPLSIRIPLLGADILTGTDHFVLTVAAAEPSAQAPEPVQHALDPQTLSLQTILVITDAGTVTEADGNALTYQLRLANAVAEPVTVTLSTSGTATPGSDYGAIEIQDASGNWNASTTATLPADGTAITVRIPIIDDALTEPD